MKFEVPLASSSRPTRGSVASCRAKRLTISGEVQGLGVRPAIHRLALELGLAGNVRNTGGGVEIEVEGRKADIADFTARLAESLPRGAQLTRLVGTSIPVASREGFFIASGGPGGTMATRVPRDLATCSDCLKEIFDPRDRRFRYPFTSCSACGPRYTIIERMPYERADTAMSAFTMCADCMAEYHDPVNRRFHAQTNACPRCGPTIWTAHVSGQISNRGDDAIAEALDCLHGGGIVALKGLGGYQLLVDATSESAVSRLRERKGRRGKPLAVLTASLDEAKRLVDLDEVAARELLSPANPIVVVPARTDTPIAVGVHPGLRDLGLMLPTTPLHHLVAREFGGPLVCTSANREGEPIVFENDAARRSLEGVCDLWVHHDRPITRPIDDSVVRVIAGRPVTIRLARGLAPWPLELSADVPTTALGGHLKAAFALATANVAVLCPHVGDLDTIASRERYEEQRGQIVTLYEADFTRAAHDLHPDYFTSRLAHETRRDQVATQHHHAHVVSAMLEHQWLNHTVLGVSWDGTGYGTDGTIWGGEFLIVDSPGFERFAHIRPFRLPGGEAAIREPWRTAAYISEELGDDGDDLIPDVGRERWRITRRIAADPRWSVLTTSAGRLFDAAAAIILGIDRAEYDGQPALLLEACVTVTNDAAYPFPIVEDALPQLDWRPLFGEMILDRRRRVPPGVMAMKFHRALATGIIQICDRLPELPIALAGGVFQNRLLVELIAYLAQARNREIALPGRIPPNDGGLAAGQLAIAATRRAW